MEDQGSGTLTCKNFGSFVVVELPDQTQGGVSLDRAASDLGEICNQNAWNEQVRVVVLHFDGRFLDPHVNKSDVSGPAGQGSLVAPVAQLKQPVIAAIKGEATGPGLELALACDLRIGAENARFGMPQIMEGWMPSNGGTQRLPRLIGRSRAMQMILTGETIDAAEALRCGLIHRVVPSEAVLDSALELAKNMAEKSPLALSYAKEALNKGLDLTLDQGINAELDLYLLLFSTFDRTEGITAFKEKRKPKFEGV